MKLSARYQRDPLIPRTQAEQNDYDASRLVFGALHHHYRGYPWVVDADVAGGVARFRIQHIMPENTWWTVHIANMGPDMKAVKEGGGRMLEHFKLPRHRADIAAYMQIRKSLGLIDPNARMTM